MKLASGSAASSITPTATITATIMIGNSSVMPTAVRIESIEKTMSSSRIWTIAAPKPSDFWLLVLSSAESDSAGSTLWWISVVAL